MLILYRATFKTLASCILLVAAGLETAPEANRQTLFRRLYLDLTGFPPSPAKVEAFVRGYDKDVAAVARRQTKEANYSQVSVVTGFETATANAGLFRRLRPPGIDLAQVL